MQKFLKSVAKIAQILITTSLALLLSCNLYLVVMARAFGIENPTIFGYSTAVVVSGSMEPALSVDDLILNLRIVMRKVILSPSGMVQPYHSPYC